MRLSLLCVLGGLAMAGCAIPRSGYIYSPTVGGRGSVVFPDSVQNAGPLQATLSGGERCTGRYSTVPGPHVSWDDEKINTIYSEDTQDGMALLQCNAGHLLRCTFTRSINGDGIGRCVDNHSDSLTLYF
ncbi:MAG TPA: hypothetical protein VHB79_22945 [Polyangiaceae bacterium]|nr:hypothetical protein [Polyangiaceae bacterium]